MDEKELMEFFEHQNYQTKMRYIERELELAKTGDASYNGLMFFLAMLLDTHRPVNYHYCQLLPFTATHSFMPTWNEDEYRKALEGGKVEW